MTTGKVSFYFVLYLVVLVELLAVIIERDNSELELKKRLEEFEAIQDSMIAAYSQPIYLNVKEVTDWLITKPRDSVHVLITVSNLQTPEEKAGVHYLFIQNTENDEGLQNFSLIVDKNTGNGNFYFRSNRSGTFDFNVFCYVRRKLPHYLPAIIRDGIARRIGNEFNAFSDTVDFKINAKVQTVEFDQPGRG